MSSNTTRRLPNFLIIGALKAGTTSLFVHLSQHPDVFMSTPKEPLFFTYGPWARALRAGLPATLDEYAALFANAGAARAIGEATPSYLHSPLCPQRIRETLGAPRLIALLRQPADRAFSHYCHVAGAGRDSATSFAEAIRCDADRRRRSDGWHDPPYLPASEYADAIERYVATFGRESILFLRFEDLQADSVAVARRACEFLEVDPEPIRPERAHNAGAEPRAAWIASLKARTRGLRNALRPLIPTPLLVGAWKMAHRRPQLDAGLRAELTARFRDDIARTAELTGLDLSGW